MNSFISKHKIDSSVLLFVIHSSKSGASVYHASGNHGERLPLIDFRLSFQLPMRLPVWSHIQVVAWLLCLLDCWGYNCLPLLEYSSHIKYYSIAKKIPQVVKCDCRVVGFFINDMSLIVTCLNQANIYTCNLVIAFRCLQRYSSLYFQKTVAISFIWSQK